MSDIVDRLLGRYPIGPIGKDGEPEFGWRQFDHLPPIQSEAAAEITKLRADRAAVIRECAAVVDKAIDNALESCPPNGRVASSAFAIRAAILALIEQGDR